MPHVDPALAVAGLAVGFLVGLTGMGGGALMTPILILVFRVQPLAAVSSDLVASFFMKPVAAGVHLRRRTVQFAMVGWLALGSVPAAFAGVVVLRLLGHGRYVQQVTQFSLGVALLVASAAIVFLALLNSRRRARPETGTVRIKPLPTVLVGIVGGLIVGMTSVGSGSLVIACLLMLYPALRSNQLVGTDIVQAIPLVGSAALGHLLFGDFKLAITISLLLGAIPGAYLGARISAQAPTHVVRGALMLVLLATGLKLVNVPSIPLLLAVGGALVVGVVVYALTQQSAPGGRPPQPDLEAAG